MTTFDETAIKRVAAGDPASRGGQFAEQQKAQSSADFPVGEPAESPTDVYGKVLGRGGIARHGGTGAAFVLTDDDDDPVYKSGPNKGMPKLVTSKAPSSYGVKSNTRALELWKQRQLMLALSRDPEFGDRVRAALDAIDDLDSKEGKAVLNKLVDEGHEIAKTQLAADRGTFAHYLTELKDQDLDPVNAVASGADLGIDAGTAQRIIDGWESTCAEHGLVSEEVEVLIDNREFGATGTADRVFVLERAKRVDFGDGPIEIPAGSRVIGDLKTGSVDYPASYTSQLAIYAGGVPYDPINHKRGEWKSPINQDVGIIVQPDLKAIAENPDVDPKQFFSVHYIDLRVGRRYAEASRQLRDAEYAANKGITPAFEEA